MTPRQIETMNPMPQPVRMYKVIAVSFLALAIIIFGVIIVLSAKRATITIETKAEPVLVSGVFTVGGNGPDHIAGIVTTTLVSTDMLVVPTGATLSPGIATGRATIHNTTDQNQTLIATTRLLSTEGVLFRMKKTTAIPARGTAVVDIYADAAGASGNVSSTRFSIPGLPVVKQAQIYADSDTGTTGGLVSSGTVQKSDIDTATASVRTALLEQGKQLIAAAFTDKQAAFTLSDESITADPLPASGASQVTVHGKALLVAVLYDANDLTAAAKTLLSKRQVAGADLMTPSHDAPTASIDSFDAATDAAKLKIFYSGIATMNPESQALAKSVFFGKSADEVRRYVLSLDRVHGVDVTFSPSWVDTVPSMSDHVTVVVKQVQ